MGKEMFDNIPSKVADLLADVRSGRIGLPDLQRPFVWRDNKVRELLDSMMRGYPIGYVMLWSSPEEYENTSQIGSNGKMYKRPDDLVIDGQQRLTALLAAMCGVTIRDKDFKQRRIRISFNPLTREFAVWTQAYDRDPEWISDISTAFAADQDHTISKFRKAFIKSCNEGRQRNGVPELTDEEEELVEQNINDLLNLGIYSLPTLKINSRADEEDVAEIFVRVNSGGQKLTEKNFIETLLAVYDNEVHDRINDFCAKSRIPANGTPYNQIITVDPVHLIRVAVGVGFKRARLKYAYMLMRGKDLKTGEITAATRSENLGIFKNTLDMVTNLNNWHAFLNLFAQAGYMRSSIIASSNAVVFSYVMYLLGKYEYKVPTMELQQIIKRWIFMTTITGFYTNSPESTVERQFADLRDVHTADEYVSYLDTAIRMKMTDDYFNLTLPNDLSTAAAISPAWFGYLAALNVLGTPMLFSTVPLSQFFVMGTSGVKNSVDKHHLFPKNYLASIGIEDDRDRNQIANFTFIDYQTNIDISDDPPAVYAARFRTKLGEEAFRLSCRQNAIPEGFETMDYFAFLSMRRILMAGVVREAYERLSQ